MKIRSVICSGFSIVRILMSLLWMWLSLGWRVRKARKAFERQLIKAGMSKRDARRLSAHYEHLKDQIIGTVTSSFKQ